MSIRITKEEIYSKFIQERRIYKRVLVYCSYDMRDSAKNHLAETYRNNPFTLLDIMRGVYENTDCRG